MSLASCSEETPNNFSFRAVILEFSGDGATASSVPEDALGAIELKAELSNEHAVMLKGGRLFAFMCVNKDGKWGIPGGLLEKFQEWSASNQYSEVRLWLDGGATYTDSQAPDISRPILLSDVEEFLRGLSENDNSVFYPYD